MGGRCRSTATTWGATIADGAAVRTLPQHGKRNHRYDFLKCTHAPLSGSAVPSVSAACTRSRADLLDERCRCMRFAPTVLPNPRTCQRAARRRREGASRSAAALAKRSPGASSRATRPHTAYSFVRRRTGAIPCEWAHSRPWPRAATAGCAARVTGGDCAARRATCDSARGGRHCLRCARALAVASQRLLQRLRVRRRRLAARKPRLYGPPPRHRQSVCVRTCGATDGMRLRCTGKARSDGPTGRPCLRRPRTKSRAP